MKIDLTIENVFNVDEVHHVVNLDEAVVLANYFEELDEVDYEVEDFEAKTCLEIANWMDSDFEPENLMHIIVTLFPDKYEPKY
jgi:hypothetical protein